MLKHESGHVRTTGLTRLLEVLQDPAHKQKLYIDIHHTAASLGSGNDYGQGQLVNQLLQVSAKYVILKRLFLYVTRV